MDAYRHTPNPCNPFTSIDGDLSQGILLLCDHASSFIPSHYSSLGLPQGAFERHISYDIGAKNLTLLLSQKLGVPAILSQFSRLLIDPNRGEDDPTLIMKISDGQPVPGNLDMSDEERARRLNKFYHPYHQAIRDKIDEFIEKSKPPVLLSIHSFTPVWRGAERPWEAAVLWDNDPRFARPFLKALSHISGGVIGDNEPYTGRLIGDSMYRHGTRRGLAHCLLEVRQDLLGSNAGIEKWCEYITKALQVSLQAGDLHEIKQYGSLAK